MSSLRSTIATLASDLAAGVLAAIRASSLDELLSYATPAPSPRAPTVASAKPAARARAKAPKAPPAAKRPRPRTAAAHKAPAAKSPTPSFPAPAPASVAASVTNGVPQSAPN